MSSAVVVENLGKKYTIGHLGSGSLREAISRPFVSFRGHKPNTSREEFWALKDVSFAVERAMAWVSSAATGRASRPCSN